MRRRRRYTVKQQKKIDMANEKSRHIQALLQRRNNYRLKKDKLFLAEYKILCVKHGRTIQNFYNSGHVEVQKTITETTRRANQVSCSYS